jgi:hypothetical protein
MAETKTCPEIVDGKVCGEKITGTAGEGWAICKKGHRFRVIGESHGPTGTVWELPEKPE